jgi:hypothetical protein
MENELKFNNPKGSLDFDHINEYAKKFRLSVERDAFMEGVRLGFQLASDRYLKYLSEFEKRRANNIIVIKNNESE